MSTYREPGIPLEPPRRRFDPRAPLRPPAGSLRWLGDPRFAAEGFEPVDACWLDDDFVLVVSARSVRLFSSHTGAQVAAHPLDGAARAVSAQPDGARIFVGTAKHGVHAFRGDDLEPLQHLPLDSEFLWQLACSPCGRWLVAALSHAEHRGYALRVYAIPPPPGELALVRERALPAHPEQLAFAPSGDAVFLLVPRGAERTVARVALPDGAPRVVYADATYASAKLECLALVDETAAYLGFQAHHTPDRPLLARAALRRRWFGLAAPALVPEATRLGPAATYQQLLWIPSRRTLVARRAHDELHAIAVDEGHATRPIAERALALYGASPDGARVLARVGARARPLALRADDPHEHLASGHPCAGLCFDDAGASLFVASSDTHRYRVADGAALTDAPIASQTPSVALAFARTREGRERLLVCSDTSVGTVDLEAPAKACWRLRYERPYSRARKTRPHDLVGAAFAAHGAQALAVRSDGVAVLVPLDDAGEARELAPLALTVPQRAERSTSSDYVRTVYGPVGVLALPATEGGGYLVAHGDGLARVHEDGRHELVSESPLEAATLCYAPTRRTLWLRRSTGAVDRYAYTPRGVKHQKTYASPLANGDRTELEASVFPATLAVSPDGARVALGTRNGAVEILDAGSLRPLHALPTNARYVTALAFSPDGALLAAALSNGTAVLWDARSDFSPP